MAMKYVCGVLLLTTLVPFSGGGALASKWVVAHLEAMEYPGTAARSGAEGTVILECKLSEDGRVDKVEVVRAPGTSAGHSALVKAAKQNASTWGFRMLKESGMLPETVRLTYEFRVDSGCVRSRRCVSRFTYRFPDRVTVGLERWE